MGEYDYGSYGYYDINSTCPDGYFLYMLDTTVPWTFHVGAVMSYVICVFNVFVVLTFIRTRMVTPATMMLMALAVSDTMAAFCQSLPRHYGMLMEFINQQGTRFSQVRYSYCSFLIITEGPLFYAIHDMSIFLVTLLGIIKVLAIRFPIWFKINVGKRVPVIGPFISLIVGLGLEIYPTFSFSFRTDADGWCCNNGAFHEYDFKYSIVGQWVLPVVYLLAFASATFSTAYIAGKLTCFRSSIEYFGATERARRRNRRSAINIVIITIVFIVTEILDFLCVLSPLLTYIFGLRDLFSIDWYVQAFYYQRLILEVGFASNFVVYLISSKDIRQNLLEMLTCSRDKHLKAPARSTNISSFSSARKPDETKEKSVNLVLKMENSAGLQDKEDLGQASMNPTVALGPAPIPSISNSSLGQPQIRGNMSP